METDSEATCLHAPHKKKSRTGASVPIMLSAASHRGLPVLSCDRAFPFVLLSVCTGIF